ncbi:MAG TPA: hypothetical protein VIF62_12055 [Labilithrix sp.]
MMRPLVIAALSGLLAACASGEADDPSGGESDVVTSAPPRPPEQAARPPISVSPLEFQCRSDAFCENFESADPSARWTSESGAGILFAAPSASRGARSLRVATDAPAFLVERGKASVAGALSVAFRLDAAPRARLGGPAIVVGDASIVLAIAPEGIVLEQHDAWCPSCRKREDLVAPAAPGTWHFVVLGFEANGATSAPYGRLEIGVDGGDLSTVALDVPLYGADVELHAGVTTADVGAGNALAIDDVMFLLH